MAQVILDLEAIRQAQATLRALRDTAQREAQRYGNLAGEAEWILRDLAGSIVGTLDPQHGFDPMPRWEQSGLGRLAYWLRESHATMDGVQGAAQSALYVLYAAHGELVGGRMAARGDGVGQSLRSAVSLLWDITLFFVPGNLLRFLHEPWVPTGRFNDARSGLEGLVVRIEEYVAWLERTALGEEEFEELLVEAPSSAAVEQWLKTHAADVQLGGKIVSDVVTVAGVIPKVAKRIGGPLAIFGLVADVVQGGDYSQRALAVDGNAALIESIPGVDLVAGILGASSLGFQGVGWGLQQVAQLFGGQSRAQIEYLSQTWDEQSKAIDPDPLAHALGKVASDLEGTEIQLRTLGTVDPQFGDFGKLGGDAEEAINDAGSLMWGVANAPGTLLVDTTTTVLDVAARTLDAPGWLQGPLDWAAGPGQGPLEAVAHELIP